MTPPINHKAYLGDGAYVDLGAFPGEVVITTEDGISVQNSVVLDMNALRILIGWLRLMKLIEQDDRQHEAMLSALEFIVNDAPEGGDARLTVTGYNRACAAIAEARR
jgi:hypothetical protein